MSAPLWLIALPLIASPIIYFMGHKGQKREAMPGSAAFARGLALIILATTFFPFVLASESLLMNGPSLISVGMIHFRFDGVSLLMAGVVITLALLAALFSVPYLEGTANETKFYALLTIMVGSIIGMVGTDDLFNLWLWFETMTISTYTLVAFYHEEATSLEAGIKYLAQSTVGSILVLLGVALILAQTGTVDLAQIRQFAGPTPGLLAASVFLLVGFGVKASLVPLHTWLPDAHAQAPSGVSAMLSGVVIEAALVAMLRTLGALHNVSTLWGLLLMSSGALNMLLGNLMALRQQQVKRMLAFSSLSHMGYILLGLGVSLHTGVLAGAQGSAFHVINHGLMKGLAFLAAGALLYTLHLAHGRHAPLMITDLHGAARRYPVLGLTLSIALLALGGLPPLAGFMSKWQIFLAGFAAGDPLTEGFVIFAALMSVLSLGYYVPLVNALYRQEMSEAVIKGKPVPGVMLLPLVILSLAVVIIGVWPGLVGWLTAPAGAAWLAAFGR